MWQHHKRTGLSEDAARFYAAAVVLALKYLNDRDIMWRCAGQAAWSAQRLARTDPHSRLLLGQAEWMGCCLDWHHVGQRPGTLNSTHA